MSAATVTEAWDRIEAWGRRHHPGLLGTLNPGASEADVAAVERQIGQPLPDDVRESLFRHNGQPGRMRAQFLFGSITLANCQRIASEYESWKGSDSPDPPTHFSFFPEGAIAYRDHDDDWIPIAYEDGCGNFLAVDLDPGPKGVRGQVIGFGADIWNLGVMAPSWGEFLLSYARLLESGVLTDVDTDLDYWGVNFETVLSRAVPDELVLWAMDGRWPIVDFDPAWRTADAVGRARRIDETRDFSTMPLLADALMDAGCECAPVLNHCRDPECTHTKGCWIIDMVLRGKVEQGRFCHKFPNAAWDNKTVEGPIVFLDEPAQPAAEAATESDAATGQSEVKERKLIGPPVWGPDKRAMLWTEIGDDGEPEPMLWELDTDDERREAQQFYDAVSYCNWTTPEELEALLREPGPWLIRWRYLDRLLFLSCVDEGILFDDADPEAEVFVDDPEKAVQVDSALALRLVPRLTKDYAGDGGSGVVIEPVRLKEALVRKTW